jgi:cytochrome c oxidase subunit 4
MSAQPVRRLLLSWVSLLALLAITLASAYVHLGAFNTVINLGVAVAKALIVMAIFMHLLRPAPLLRLAASAGFLWLAILIALTLVDVATRA